LRPTDAAGLPNSTVAPVGRDSSGYAGDLGKDETKIFFAMGVDSGDHTKSSPSGAVFHIFKLDHDLSTDVRFGAHSRLKSDIAALPKRAQKRTFCDALHCVPRKGSGLGTDVPEAAYVGLPLLREFQRRRDMADEYAGCH